MNPLPKFKGSEFDPEAAGTVLPPPPPAYNASTPQEPNRIEVLGEKINRKKINEHFEYLVTKWNKIKY